jgi:hypothetical protein
MILQSLEALITERILSHKTCVTLMQQLRRTRQQDLKTIDIFSAKSSWWVLLLVALFVLLDVSLPNEIRGITWLAFLLTLGLACLWNYRNCGRVHCLITGLGFISLALLILLTMLGVLLLTDLHRNVTAILVLVAGFSFELWYRSRSGSCYKKRPLIERKEEQSHASNSK